MIRQGRPDRLDALFDKRLKALMRDLPAARTGSVEAVHRTRVASRRVREALPLLDAAGSPVDKARRHTRRMTRALGTVRELDVALGIVNEVPASARPAQRLAIERVREHLVRERERSREAMLERLDYVRPDRMVRKIEGTLESREVKAQPTGEWQQALQNRLSVRAQRLAAAIEHAGAIYLSDRLHDARIAAKKLRYSLELAADSGLGARTAALRTLKQAQELLGELHDLEIVIGHVEHVQGTGKDQLPPDQQKELDLIVRELQDRCRELHGQYFRRRTALLKVVAAASLSQRASVARPRRTRTAAPNR